MEKEKDYESDSICGIYEPEMNIEGDYSFITKKPLTQYKLKEVVNKEPDDLGFPGNCVIFEDIKPDSVDDSVCKCTFYWESRGTKIMNYYINTEGNSKYFTLTDVKLWLVSKTQLLMKLIYDADSDCKLKYLENYLIAISNLKYNCFISLDEGFCIECFIVDGYTTSKEGERIG